MTKITYEKATIEDCKEIALLRFNVMKEHYPKLVDKKISAKLKQEIKYDDAKYLEYQRVLPKKASNLILVAKNDKKIVGFVYARRTIKKFGRIKDIFVDSKYQGQGIGSELLEKSLNWLKKRKYISLSVLKKNEKAIKLYEQFGFEIKKTKDYTLNIGNFKLGNYKMAFKKTINMNKYKSGDVTIIELKNLKEYNRKKDDLKDVDLVIFDEWQEGLIKYPSHVTFKIRLPEKIEDYLMCLNKKDRYYVRKYVKEVGEKFQMEILEKITRKDFEEWNKGYVHFIQNKKFGENRLNDEWLNKNFDNLRIIFIYHNHNLIGGVVYRFKDDTISMSFAWYSDLLKQYGGGTAIVYKLIEKCIENKFPFFKFGRDPNLFGGRISLGLHHFKTSMGGIAYPWGSKYKGALFTTKKHLIYYELDEQNQLKKVEINN